MQYPSYLIRSPVLIGFQWSYSFTFAVGDINNPIDLSLYDIHLTLKGWRGGNVITPTIATLTNGLAKASLTDTQTRTMETGKYSGFIFLESKAGKDTSFLTQIEIDAILPEELLV